MINVTPQVELWSTEFGKEYTDRNMYTTDELNALYLDRYNVSRTEMNQRFLGHLDHDIRILEVGANVGNQLITLQEMGFTDLWGIEIQWYAVDISRKRTRQINFLHADALDIPFKDNFFDLVFTSGVLIHIAPDILPRALQEIYRCSKAYIWGFEYWAESLTEIQYHGQQNLLWKTDYSRLYRELFPDLTLVKEEHHLYKNDPSLEDAMFLFRKG